MLYLNQLDYRHIPYYHNAGQGGPHPDYNNVATSGCGLCSLCMLINHLTGETLSVEECVKLSETVGGNYAIGTRMTVLGPVAAEKFGLEYSLTSDVRELVEHLKNGGEAIARVVGVKDGTLGIFTRSRHYIQIPGLRGEQVMVLDPSFKEGKYDEPLRQGLVEVDYPFVYCSPEVLAAELDPANPEFYLFKKKSKEPNIHSRYPQQGEGIGNGLRISHRSGMIAADFNEFLQELQKEGFTLGAQNAIGTNRYAELKSGDQTLYLSHTAKEQYLRMVSDDGSFYQPLPRAETFEKLGKTTLWVMPLDYAHREVSDGNGMSFVLQLADGRYLIWDGGYAQDAAPLYEFLCAHNLRKGKPVIAGWIMTHSHNDHYGCFKAFTQAYADQVELQYWIANPAPHWMFYRCKGYDSFLSAEVYDLLKKYPTVQFVCPHSGQKFTFCDAELEVLFTWEDHYPRGMSNMNDTSLVLRLKVGEKNLLFLGDAVNESNDKMSERLGAALKSDYLQVPHHGYSGGTVELYKWVAPEFAFWPTSQVAFDLRTTGEKYKWIGNALESNKYLYDTIGREHCYVADGEPRSIVFE